VLKVIGMICSGTAVDDVPSDGDALEMLGREGDVEADGGSSIVSVDAKIVITGVIRVDVMEAVRDEDAVELDGEMCDPVVRSWVLDEDWVCGVATWLSPVDT
jgi:hypothetical protein